MPKQNEKTESKLILNLETLINEVTTFGAVYKPPNPHSEIEAMSPNLTAAKTKRIALQQKEAAESGVRHDREDLHKPIGKLCTDFIKYCDSAGWDENDLETLRSFSREYRGGRAEPLREDDPVTPDVDESKKNISTAQTSYASKTEHFANLVESARAKAGFDPPEEKFKFTTLDATIAAMRDANSAVSAAETATGVLRAELDGLLYTNPDNLVDAANSSKKYVGSVFGDSQIYQNIKDLDFEKPRRLE